MPAHIIIGTQWGDEGKGRISDLLAAEAQIVARSSGGDNAGHTIRVGDKTTKLHIVPSGILHPHTLCVMGGGMAVNPLKLVEELQGLAEQGVDIDPARVKLAESAHLITAAHRAFNSAKESSLGQEQIGTTRRGIGPAYTDKTARIGLRAGQMQDADTFALTLREHLISKNRQLTTEYAQEALPIDETIEEMLEAAVFLAPYLADVPLLLHHALKANQTILCEGAQGTLLDLDFGHYPYVTSSNPTIGGVLSGLGIGPKDVGRVIGVAKAFSSRVGSGPFPTELDGEAAESLRGTGANPWDEFGTTTGRPRRVGWLDTVVLRYAARINGLTELILTKLDVLSGIDNLQVADAYQGEEESIRALPTHTDRFEACLPIYEPLPGWEQDIMDTTQFEALPEAAQAYVKGIETRIDLPITTVTVGPARRQTIWR